MAYKIFQQLESGMAEKGLVESSEIGYTRDADANSSRFAGNTVGGELDRINKKLDDIESTPSGPSNVDLSSKADKDHTHSYTDLTDKPEISEDESGKLTVVDESGNIIFKVDHNGIETTAISAKTVTIDGKQLDPNAPESTPTPEEVEVDGITIVRGEDNKLRVNCATDFDGDNTRPAEIGFVKTLVGDIETLLQRL